MIEPRRILFIRTDRMGDVLMNLPAIQELRKTHPKSWIALMVDKGLADLFNEHPDIDELITVEPSRIASSASYRAGLIKRLRKAKFDIAVVSNPDRRLHWMVFAAGIKTRIGYDRKWGFLLNKRYSKAHGADLHEIEKNLGLIPDGNKNYSFRVALSAGDRSAQNISAKLKDLPPGQKFIAVHTGTSNPAKRWPETEVIAFCRMIQKQLGECVVFIGGEEERGVANTIQSQLTGKSLNLAGHISLKELIALFGHPQARAAVSVDSGPAHVAWMSGRPAVILYARNAVGSDPKRWGPRDNKSRVIFKNIDEITASEVFKEVEALEK